MSNNKPATGTDGWDGPLVGVQLDPDKYSDSATLETMFERVTTHLYSPYAANLPCEPIGMRLLVDGSAEAVHFLAVSKRPSDGMVLTDRFGSQCIVRSTRDVVAYFSRRAAALNALGKSPPCRGTL